MTDTPKTLPNNFVAQLFHGAAYPLRGLGFIRRNRLWGLAGAAIVVNIVLFGILTTLSLMYAGPWLTAAEVWLEDSWLAFMSALVYIIGVALLVLLNGVLLAFLGTVIAGPFLEALSEKTEAIVTGKEPKPFSLWLTLRSIAVSIMDLFWALIFFVAISLPLLVLGPIAPVVNFIFTALLLAQEFVGLPMVRRLEGYRQRWRMTWKNRWLTLGFGSTAMALVLVPGLNLILLPLAAVGGTLLYTDLVSDERV